MPGHHQMITHGSVAVEHPRPCRVLASATVLPERHGHVKALPSDLGLEPDSPTRKVMILRQSVSPSPVPASLGDRADLAGTTRRSVPSPLARCRDRCRGR